MSNEKIDAVHFKHRRWRRLRQWLHLEEQVGNGTSTAQKKLADKVSYPVKELGELNHNLRRLLIENYY